MNNTDSRNQTSLTASTCLSFDLSYSVHMSGVALDIIILLPIQIRVLSLGMSSIIKIGHLAPSEILTMNLSAVEVLMILLYLANFLAFLCNSQYMKQISEFFLGSYLCGRPMANSLICVERYIAVAHPVIYRKPLFVSHRYMAAALVWVVILGYGGANAFGHLTFKLEIFTVSLSINILVMASCSLLVLKILLKHSPSETQKKKINSQKQKAFRIITAILVLVSVPYILDVLLFIKERFLDLNIFCLLTVIVFWMMRPSSLIQSVVYLSKKKKWPCSRKGST